LSKVNTTDYISKIKNNNRRMMGGFSKTPNHFTLNKNYSPYEKAVYNVLLTRSMNKGSCFPSQQTIAKEAGCGLTKVKSVLKSLENKNLIRKEKGSKHRSNKYYILSHNKSFYDHSVSPEKTTQ
jgi:DNA-binding MarR family transcriptional regulator